MERFLLKKLIKQCELLSSTYREITVTIRQLIEYYGMSVCPRCKMKTAHRVEGVLICLSCGEQRAEQRTEYGNHWNQGDYQQKDCLG